MIKPALAPLTPIARIPKSEAIDRINRHLIDLRSELDLAKAKLKAGISPGKYLLNIQVNALKKQINSCKAHVARLQKEPKTEVVWSDKLGA